MPSFLFPIQFFIWNIPIIFALTYHVYALKSIDTISFFFLFRLLYVYRRNTRRVVAQILLLPLPTLATTIIDIISITTITDIITIDNIVIRTYYYYTWCVSIFSYFAN